MQNGRVKMVPVTGQVLCEEYMEMDEAESLPQGASRRMCKGKETNAFEEPVCAVYVPSHFENYLGLNLIQENTEIEIGLKDWDLNLDLLDSKIKTSYNCCEGVVP